MAEDEAVTTKEDSENTEQDGGLADAQTERFEDHKWESDEDWQMLLRGLDFGTITNEDKKMKYIEKRKHKFFRDNYDPSHEIPKIAATPRETRSRGARYQAPPGYEANNDDSTAKDESTGDNNDDTNDNNDGNDGNDDDGEAARKKQEAADAARRAQEQQRRQQQQQQQQRSYSSQRSQLTKMQELLNYFYVFGQWFIFVNCMISVLIPSLHYTALMGVIALHIVALLQNTGRPRFDMYYAQTLFQDENVMIAIYALMFLMGPPVFVFLIPIALRSLNMGSYMLNHVLSQKMPSIHAKIHPLLKKVTSNYYWFVTNIALAEVGVGIFLFPACLFINRTVILTLFYWQIMHARYMMSQPIKNAFTMVNQKFETAFARVPALLSIYQKVANFLYDKVDPVKLQEQMRQQQSGAGAGGGIGGMLQKCTIM